MQGLEVFDEHFAVSGQNFVLAEQLCVSLEGN